ncbi:MAG: DsbA family oxidoreductase [Pseudomonadota bacterium]
MIPLDILSDPICPWCCIGKARLDKAIAETGRNPFVLRWRMFRLNPDMPVEGMDRRAYLEAKFGGPERAQAVYDSIAETAAADGLDLHLDKIARTPNTLDAHRLIRWAATEQCETVLVERLFDDYFRQGRDISERSVLLDAAEAVGLERSVIACLLDGDSERAALEAEEAEARSMGVGGVPCFIVNGRHVLSGAQDSATWARVIFELDQALAQSQSPPQSAAEGQPS